MNITKGEWKVGKLRPLDNWVVGVDLDNPMEQNIVASLFNNEDDANLIAAAPDLYTELKKADKEICQFCKESMEATMDCITCEDREARLKALSKADSK